jgi:transposase
MTLIDLENQTELTEINPRVKYSDREDKKYWGVYWLNIAGWKKAHIAKTVGYPHSTVTSIIKRIKETRSPMPRKSTGRPKIITKRGERHMEKVVRDTPFMSFDQVRHELSTIGIIVSVQTVISTLSRLGFGSYFAAHKPRLTPRHMIARLAWAGEHVNWTDEQWASVIWSDESRYTVDGNDGGARVIRKKGERYMANHIVPTTKWGSGSVMVWGCFWKGSFGPLVRLEGGVDQEAYINILSNRFVPWAAQQSEQHNKEFIFQEDGASCHTGHYARWWKESHGVTGFDYWPAQSPDLNPIEHIWHALEHRLSKIRASITDVETLWLALQREWEQLGLELSSKLIQSMRDRCQAVIDAKGGYTRY